MPSLRAHVRYGDWEGTAAADNADLRSLRWYLEERGAFDPKTEFIAAIEFSIPKNRDRTVEQAHISGLIGKLPPGDTWVTEIKARESLSLRSVPIEMSIPEFLGYFKRFQITLTPGILGLTDREYEVRD